MLTDAAPGPVRYMIDGRILAETISVKYQPIFEFLSHNFTFSMKLGVLGSPEPFADGKITIYLTAKKLLRLPATPN